MKLDAIQPTKTTSSLIADALRSAIMQGQLREGQSLKQDEIANEFKVSKIPVREALVQLQAEGLVRLIPSRGAVVSRLSPAEINEIYSIRIALEPVALRQAIPHLKEEDLFIAEHTLNKIDAEDDMTRWADLNWQFHSTLYARSEMPLLIQIVQTLHHNVARYLLVNYLNKDYLKRSQQQHRTILEYCRRRDVEAACQTLEDHLHDPMDRFIARS